MPSMHIPARTQLRSQKENRGKRGWKTMSLLSGNGTGQTYTVYKVVEGEKTVIGVAVSPTEASQIIEDDMQIYDDNANYIYERDKP